MSAGDVVLALIIGAVTGAFSGLLGVGGGIIMVPAMVLVLGEPQHVAQGTSLLVIVPTAVIGTLANRRRGNVEAASARAIALGGIAGAVVGALISLQLDEDVLRRIFGAVIVLISLRLVTSGRGRAPATERSPDT